ncbi:MAG TPA: hypothetical protein PKJ19_06500 [Flavobacteriales bacterium]|nr:hypothetical protein [Flavobacteriales bacterium]
MTYQEDIATHTTISLISYMAGAIAFEWRQLLPPPENAIQFTLGALLMLSAIVYNVVRILQHFRDKKEK